MKVADCMSRNICVLSRDNSLQSAAQLMAEMDSGFLPVADKDELIGIVTDRDIAIRGVGMGLAPSAGVEEVMSDEVRYCFAEDEVEKVLHTMGTLQVRRLPVLDRDKRLVGVVSLSDLATNGAAPAAGEALGDIAQPSEHHSQRL
ncbi:MAG: CBS domain-containing protein [Sphingopyxis granuli]|jgi:CBS domain-containing protein